MPEKSGLVHKEFKTVKNPDETIKYVLELKELPEEDEKYQLPTWLPDGIDADE